MNKILTSMAAVVLLMFSNAVKADMPIAEALANVSDDTLRTCLTNATDGKVYAEQLTILRCGGRQGVIVALDGLGAFTNLTYLLLIGHQIPDIDSLSGLTNLTFLNLTSNQIQDIISLGGLTNLTSLNLRSNQIQNIDSLSGLTNLTFLNLVYNQIQNIDSLSGLTNLTSLSLENNEIQILTA